MIIASPEPEKRDELVNGIAGLRTDPLSERIDRRRESEYFIDNIASSSPGALTEPKSLLKDGERGELQPPAPVMISRDA